MRESVDGKLLREDIKVGGFLLNQLNRIFMEGRPGWSDIRVGDEKFSGKLPKNKEYVKSSKNTHFIKGNDVSFMDDFLLQTIEASRHRNDIFWSTGMKNNHLSTRDNISGERILQIEGKIKTFNLFI